jgi:hypothetical protein
MTCTRASRFLDANGIAPAEVVPASRKLGKRDAAALVKAATRVVVAKGGKVQEFASGGKVLPAAVDALLGPTGNLRAPTLRAGRTLLVGFDDATFRAALL